MVIVLQFMYISKLPFFHNIIEEVTMFIKAFFKLL